MKEGGTTGDLKNLVDDLTSIHLKLIDCRWEEGWNHMRTLWFYAKKGGMSLLQKLLESIETY